MNELNNEHVINRRCKTSLLSQHNKNNDHKDSLTLADKLLLISLQNGRTPYLNEHLSASLRASFLVELEINGNIGLASPTLNNHAITRRDVIVKTSENCNEQILNEAMQHLRTDRAPVQDWLERLNGDNWNPAMWKYQMKNVRNRLAKGMVDKGVLMVSKSNFLIFDDITYPLRDEKVKYEIFKTIHETLLDNWTGRPMDIDIHTLALIIFTYSSDLMTDVFAGMRISETNLATKRLNKILDINFQKESQKHPELELSYAVFTVILH